MNEQHTGHPPIRTKMNDHLTALADRLTDFRLRETDHGDHGEHVFHRREFQLAKLGMVDTFVVARVFDEAPTPEAFTTFSRRAMSLGRRHKFVLPCGLFSALVTYPLAIVPTVPPDLSDHIAQYAPKHYSAFEFPALLDADGHVYMFPGTPLWGAVHYQGLRAEAEAMFGG
ncbi:MAG: hypothetical protein ABMB14_27865 [Myxococcota bacterium]